MRLLLLLLSLVAVIHAEGLLFFQESKDQWHPTGGTVVISDEEFILKGSASIDMVTPSFFPPQAGRISFFMQHTLHDPGPMSLVQGSKHRCHCALKLRMGSLEFEIGESNIKAQSLKEDLTLNKVLTQKEFELEKCGDEFLVEIKFNTDTLDLYINKVKEISIPQRKFNLYDITFATFMGEFSVTSFTIESDADEDIIVNTTEKQVLIPALYLPSQFNKPNTLHNHHLVTWYEGKAAGAALFVSPIPDAVIFHALKKIGATPGNNLTTDSWDKRFSKKSKDPDIVATGTPLTITVIKDNKRYPLENIVHDTHNKGYNFVFSGNLEFIPVWHSGCIICLQSCPGSKVANSSYTMRDLVAKNSTFSVESNGIKPGESVWIEFALKR